jgi:gliding motility-associated-like protein
VELEVTTVGGNSSAIQYFWSAGNPDDKFNSFIPEVSGYYFATVDDHCHAQLTDSVWIELLPTPASDFYWLPEHPSIFMPDVSFIDESVDAIQWQWDFGDQVTSVQQNPVHSYSSTGMFPVELITVNTVGCTDTLIKVLEVEHVVTVYVPNSFTPNGDGKNDEFEIFTQEGSNYSISIFNRWGQVFFTSTSKLNLWNGLDPDGKDAPSGTYVYKVNVEDENFRKTYYGTVLLIR